MGEEQEKIIVDLVKSRQPEELSIKEIAEELGIWQQEASAIVGRLVKEGILKQRGKSPIRFYLGTEEQKAGKNRPPFSGIIGSQGSLSMQIQMARAAVCYPPDGLHMLILGATGVGKTMLAREIWRYAVEQRKKEMPFITLNCAEYADNPQLLLSQLFGHEKGAFTGAIEKKTGLIDQADGGILFLDEIHRLGLPGRKFCFLLWITESFAGSAAFRCTRYGCSFCAQPQRIPTAPFCLLLREEFRWSSNFLFFRNALSGNVFPWFPFSSPKKLPVQACPSGCPEMFSNIWCFLRVTATSVI